MYSFSIMFGPEDFRCHLRAVVASSKVAGRSVSLRRLDKLTRRHTGYWSQVFRGKPRMTVDHIFEILQALGVPAEEFFVELGAGLKGEDQDETLARDLLVTIRRIMEQPRKRGRS
jgi:transcriptional regulator with XRE-family HTH domain